MLHLTYDVCVSWDVAFPFFYIFAYLHFQIKSDEVDRKTNKQTSIGLQEFV